MVVVPMEVLEAIRTRRSIRNYTGEPISDEDAIKILDAARLAPSGGNRQAWNFVYIKDPKVLRMLKNCSPGLYGDATAAIVVCMPDGGRTIGILDVGFACENISLAAHSLGLGSCAVGSFNREPVKKLIELPQGWEPILVISLGCPGTVPNTPTKKPLSDVVHLNAFGRKWDKLEAR